MPPPTGFEFALNQIPLAGFAELAPFYERLPLDPYINGKFRQRRFSHFRGPAARLRRLEHMAFVQSQQVNQVAGGMRRHFAELEDGFVALSAFQAMVTAYVNFFGFDPEQREIGVHQIRILCSPEFPGTPAPEGIHQDGFDYIAIFGVGRRDIHGACTHIYRTKDQPPIFSKELLPGEVLFANDRAVFHFAEQVRPSGPGIGTWDLVVITA